MNLCITCNNVAKERNCVHYVCYTCWKSCNNKCPGCVFQSLDEKSSQFVVLYSQKKETQRVVFRHITANYYHVVITYPVVREMYYPSQNNIDMINVCK